MTGGFSVSLGDTEPGLNNRSRWAGVASVKGPSWAKLPLVTVGSLGMQILWSVEMGYASPYLISLGMSKSHMSLVFIAGPLSGLVMQPLVGAWSDRCTSRFGRRRPYLVAGTLLSTAALLLLGFTRHVASIFGLAEAPTDNLTIWLAVVSIYLIDFSVNAVMATSRALLVDSVDDQELGNAWIGRMAGLGSIAGFFVGNIRLPEHFPFFGKTQLQVLSVLSGTILILTNGITAWSVRERILISPSPSTAGNVGEGSSLGVLGTIKDIWDNIFTLPPVIMRICIIQFLSWIGWFPVLFYTTLWVSGIYKQNLASSSGVDPLDTEEEGTRAGNRALLYSSIIAMLGFIILPVMISSTDSHPNVRTVSSVSLSAGHSKQENSNPYAIQNEKRKKGWYQVSMHVATLWCISNAVFAVAMFATWIIGDKVWGANLIIGMTGFSWAVSLWAPFALIGEQIHSPSASRSDYALARGDDDEEDIPLEDRRTHRTSRSNSNSNLPLHQHTGSIVQPQMSEPPYGNLSARASRTNLADDDLNIEGEEENVDESEFGSGNTGIPHSRGVGDKAGVILGIHNVFVVIPQFIVNGISAAVFAMLEPTRSLGDAVDQMIPVPPTSTLNGTIREIVSRTAAQAVTGGFDSIGVMFRVGGICAAVACYLCWRLSRHLQS